jgi:hypothetical protein
VKERLTQLNRSSRKYSVSHGGNEVAEALELKDHFRQSSDRRMVAHVTPNFPIALARPVNSLWILSDITEIFHSKPPSSAALGHFPADFPQYQIIAKNLWYFTEFSKNIPTKGGQNFRFVTCEKPLSGWLEVVCDSLEWVGTVTFTFSQK